MTGKNAVTYASLVGLHKLMGVSMLTEPVVYGSNDH
jgi:hypothetical protein